MADESYHKGSSNGSSYRGVYGLTKPRNAVYGFDEHGQRTEVVPIKEVAGLELIEYKMSNLQDMMDVMVAALENISATASDFFRLVDKDTYNEIATKIEKDIADGQKISKDFTAILDKYKKESIDIKDYPDFL